MSAALSGMVAIVTGGGGGIGGATAEVLAADGAHVVITGRTKDTLERTAARIAPKAQASGGSIAWKACDSLIEADVARIVADAAKHWGRIDIAVNVVGGGAAGGIGPLLDCTAQGLEGTDARQRDVRIPPHQARRPGDDRRRRRLDRRRVVDASDRGRTPVQPLLRGQGGAGDDVQGRRRRARQARHPGQRRAPRPDPQQQRDPPQRDPRRGRRLHGAAADPAPGRVHRHRRTRSATSPGPSPPGPPARPSPWTAATRCAASPTSSSTGTSSPSAADRSPSGGGEGDRQRGRAVRPEHVGLVELVAGGDLDRGDPVEERLDRDAGLEPGDVGARADVGAAAEGEVAARVGRSSRNASGSSKRASSRLAEATPNTTLSRGTSCAPSSSAPRGAVARRGAAPGSPCRSDSSTAAGDRAAVVAQPREQLRIAGDPMQAGCRSGDGWSRCRR